MPERKIHRIHRLDYDKEKWEEKIAEPVRTLQLFITNRCNLRCRGCFYAHKLGRPEISFENYQKHVREHLPLGIKKAILLGGEPTLHADVCRMIEFNSRCGLKTTVYTNGFGMERLADADLSRCDVRLGVYGLEGSEKPLRKIRKPDFPVTFVYMLRRDNVAELLAAAEEMERSFGAKKLFISAIRDILKTQDYWLDTEETLTLDEYFAVIQDFVRRYDGRMEINIARRGVIGTDAPREPVKHCRFGNIFPDGAKIICPFDISRGITAEKLEFGTRPCNKNSECLLQKIVLARK